jgi:hypothetical protein
MLKKDQYTVQYAVTIFFPSNGSWLSPGRLSSRKDNCIVQIHRIKAVATCKIAFETVTGTKLPSVQKEKELRHCFK